MALYISWICMLTLSLLCGLSVQQVQPYGNLVASPLVGQRQNGPAQQVIVPGGFQQHQIFQGNFPLQNFERGLASIRAGPATSIQNSQQFAFQQAHPSPILQNNPLRSLVPQGGFSTITKQNGVYNSNHARTRQTNPLLNPNADIQYEYYDGEPGDSGDVIYQYGTEFNEPGNRPSSLSNLQGQHHREKQPVNLNFSQKAAAVNIKSTDAPRSILKSTFPPTAPQSSLISKFVRNNNNKVSTRPTQQTPSSFIPLIDDNEEPETPLHYNGRSVQGGSSRGGNNIPLRSSHFVTTTAAPTNRFPPGYLNRNRTSLLTNTTRRPVTNLGVTKRPAILRSPNGRFTLTARPPIRGRSSTTSKEDIIQTASSTYKPEGSQLSGSSTRSPVGGKNKVDEDYTFEYVNAEDYSSSQQQPDEHQYYEVSQEQSVVDRPPVRSPARNKSTETKVTVSVSAKTSTTTSTTSTTTTPQPSIESSSEESSNPGVVISVATTKSVSAGVGVTPVPTQVTTASPRVTFSRATGSSIVVASVQTSRSVAGTSKSMTVAGDSLPSGAETAPEYYEEEYSYADNYPVLTADQHSPPHALNNHHAKKPTHGLISPSPTESIMDKLDRVQSELANGVLNGLRGNTQPVVPSSAPPQRENHNIHIQAPSEQEELEGDEELEEEEEETVHNEDEEHHQTPRKIIHKSENIPLGHFETLVDADAVGKQSQHQSFGSQNQQLQLTYQQQAGHELFSSSYRPENFLATTSAPFPFQFPLSPTTKPVPALESILSAIKFQDALSPEFLPPGFSLATPAPTTATTTTTTTTSRPPSESTIVSRILPKINFEEINISALLPKGYKPTRGSEPVSTAPSTTETPEISVSTSEKPLNPLDALLKKVQFKEISDLLPPGYKPDSQAPSSEKPSLESLLPVTFENPINLLPPGYKLPSSAPTVENDKSSVAPVLISPPSSPSTTKKPGGVVFPTKPGGLRVGTRPTSTQPPTADTPPPPLVTIAAGWPTRKTTEFTGWPTSSTTPMPSTSSTTTTTTTEKPTTTTRRTTTTPPPPKRSPASMCAESTCKMEAVIRIIKGVSWKPEYADINTEEFKALENNVKRALDGAYRSSSLAPWYRAVEIEGFNRGSVLVDYFVTLEGFNRELSSRDVLKLFHKSLLNADPEDDNLPEDSESGPIHVPIDGRLRLGRYTIDPRYTDFKVRNGTDAPGPVPPEQLIPQWGIAVIVIGLASLLFVIIFGVTVLVNKHKNSKKKNTVSLTQEMLSEFNKSHLGSSGGMDNYGADDLYNMDDVWNDKQMDRTFDRKPTKVSQRSSSSGKGSANYNIYDSWKTEWNGYYYNGNYYGDSGYAPSRRRSDYDTNF